MARYKTWTWLGMKFMRLRRRFLLSLTVFIHDPDHFDKKNKEEASTSFRLFYWNSEQHTSIDCSERFKHYKNTLCILSAHIIGSQALSFKRPLLSLSVEFCLCVCQQLWRQISRKPKELAGKVLWGAYRKVVRGYRMVTSPMTSRDPMTS